MLVLSPILAWCGSLIGRVSIAGTLVAAWFGWLYVHDYKVAKRAEVATIEKINIAGKKTNAKGLKARARADAVDDPIKRLRDAGFCRDCD